MKHIHYLPLALAFACCPLHAADAPEAPFVKEVCLKMTNDVEAYIKSEEDLADDPANIKLLRDNANAVAEAAARYYAEQVKLADMLTAQADEATRNALRERLADIMKSDFRHMQSAAVWSADQISEPSRLAPAPRIMAAIPALGNGRYGSTAEMNVKMYMVSALWENYISAAYTQIYDMLAGDNPYPINIHTGDLWQNEGDAQKVGEQLKKVHEAWEPYCAAMVRAATPGMVSARFWGTGVNIYAAGVKCALCSGFESMLVALLNPSDGEEDEAEPEEGAPADDAAVHTAPATLKGKSVVMNYTQAEYRSCNSAWLPYGNVPKSKNEREKAKALYCFAECYGMAPKATRTLTPVTENGEGGIYTYKVVGPDTATITVDMNKKLSDDMEWARIYTIHFTSPTEGEATEEILMGDSEGSARNIKVSIQ